MAQYIDKDALVAEIEKITPQRAYERETLHSEFVRGQRVAYNKILSFLDTLEVKEVDLEKEATQLSQKYFPDEENIWARSNIEAHKCKSACIEMVEWFKAQKGE